MDDIACADEDSAWTALKAHGLFTLTGVHRYKGFKVYDIEEKIDLKASSHYTTLGPAYTEYKDAKETVRSNRTF